MTAALAVLGRERLTGREKGLPAGTDLPLDEIGRQGWNVVAGDLPFPLLTLRDDALDHNIALLQSYCEEHRAWLAPHGKTSMAPQLFARQLAAGAWAMTAANIAQVQVMRSFGVPRILIANELVSSYDIGYVADELDGSSQVEFFALVDSVAAVGRLVTVLGARPPRGRLGVLAELGMPSGRTGARSLAELRTVVDELRAHPSLFRVAGVEGYEGSVNPGGTGLASPQHLDRITRYLAAVADAVRLIAPLVEGPEPCLVSCGGSMFPDQVVATLGHAALPEAQLVLRSGGYVSHDEVFYGTTSPFGAASARLRSHAALRPAFALWMSVLSRPEPDLAILQAGRRDFPMDQGAPVVQARLTPEGTLAPLENAEIIDANDQHAYLRLPSAVPLGVGDVVVAGINHPCAAFDRWRVIPLIDAESNVVGAIRTFF